MIIIRLATRDDIDTIITIDHIAQTSTQRTTYINKVVNAGACYVGSQNSQVIAYGVLNYHFYEYGMIDMIYVHTGFR